MKYTQMLDTNMVPEWRNQYLDYRALDAALHKAIENKNVKSREKGVDLYYELIRFNQKFANYFSQECLAQLDKINTFHKEKLSEMKGKYNNLQDQLDQILSSAVYREIQPELCLEQDERRDSSWMDNLNTVTSVSDLFRNLRGRLGSRASANSGGGGSNSELIIPNSLIHKNRRLSSMSFLKRNKYNKRRSVGVFGEHSSPPPIRANPRPTISGPRCTTTMIQTKNDNNNNLSADLVYKEKVAALAKKFSGSLFSAANSVSNSNITNNNNDLHDDNSSSKAQNHSTTNSVYSDTKSNQTHPNNQDEQSTKLQETPVKINVELVGSKTRHNDINNRRFLDQYFCTTTTNNNNSNNNNNYYNTTNNHIQTDVDPQHQTLACSTSQSKKKIVNSYRNKISQLKFAFRELYFSLVLFEQYTQLNYSGFEQILRKHDRMFASTFGRKFYQEHVQTADFYNDLQTIDQLIEGVEHVYTLHFENGNRRRAIEKLQVPTNVYKQSSPMLDFRVGYELGMFAVLFILVILIGIISETGYDWRTVFRLYRSPLILMLFLFQSGISIVIWKHYKINHVLIFELNPRNNLSFHHFIEFGSLLGTIWCISILLFLFSERLGIRPSICPLVVVIIIVTYLFNPTATCQHRARFWLLKILSRIFTAPLHPVKFADFWIADQLVSIVPLFLDLEYLSCFYTTGEVLSVSHLTSSYARRCVTRNPQDLVIRTIVAALPAWFRCAQCLRRWRDENWLRLHLANAGKYACMMTVVILSSISQYNKNSVEFDTMRIIWLVFAIFTSSLTAYWDIIYDFGLFSKYDKDEPDDVNKGELSKTLNADATSVTLSNNQEFVEHFNKIVSNRKKKKKYPFLRKDLVYPVWVYYFAIVEDWILRFGWVITISLTEFSNIEAGLAVSMLAPLEMFRRFVWNCIRLENEQLNNCGLFRAVRDIPIEVVAPIDESHLDKVIMMMDSRDGPSMRNRLMKRRTLRPDRASFMVLRPPDSQEGSPVTRRFQLRV